MQEPLDGIIHLDLFIIQQPRVWTEFELNHIRIPFSPQMPASASTAITGYASLITRLVDDGTATMWWWCGARAGAASAIWRRRRKISKRSLSLAHQTKLCGYDSILSANTSAWRRESKTGGALLLRAKHELPMHSPRLCAVAMNCIENLSRVCYQINHLMKLSSSIVPEVLSRYVFSFFPQHFGVSNWLYSFEFTALKAYLSDPLHVRFLWRRYYLYFLSGV